MSGSGASTIPNTPVSFAEDVSNQDIDGVFAWLRPVNTLACVAFDKTVNAVIIHETTYLHMRQFLHTSPQRSTRDASVFTDDDTSGEERETGHKVPQWIGAFKLSLRTLPRDSKEGWSLGTGRGLPEGEEVDIMLAPPSQRRSTGIAGKHARLYFHKASGRMAIEARHTIKLSGPGTVDVISKNTVRVLEKGHFISVGECLYVFEYTSYAAGKEFTHEFSEFMKTHHGHGWSLHKTLSAPSGGNQLSIGDYACTPGAFATGTFGEVTAGWGRNGITVAIKRFKAPKEKSLEAHRQMMHYIGEHDNILTLLDCISDFSLEYPGAFCVYKPLAMASLSDVIDLYKSDISAQSALLVDYLEGLTYLHDQKGVMHRDIKPNNLGVVSFDPPRGILLDLDSAIRAEKSTDHMQGTVMYLAPEVIAIKIREQYLAATATGSGATPNHVPYEKGIDVWAMGLTAFALCVGHPFNWGIYSSKEASPRQGRPINHVTYETYIPFKNHIDMKRVSAGDGEANDLLGLVDRMTRWHPDDRVSANQALGIAQDVVKSSQAGLIELKGASKRKLNDA